jgi:hypothetical protein
MVSDQYFLQLIPSQRFFKENKKLGADDPWRAKTTDITAVMQYNKSAFFITILQHADAILIAKNRTLK